MKNYISHSEEDTKKFAQEFVHSLTGGTVVGLIGDLGAGKTYFVKAVAEALGIHEPVTSPTFILRNEYDVNHSIFKRFVHIDLYRLHDVRVTEDFLEDISNEDTLTFIEWPERLEKNNLVIHQITFEIGEDTERRIIFT